MNYLSIFFLLIVGTKAYANYRCADFLNKEILTFIQAGTTNIAFHSGTKVYKIPYRERYGETLNRHVSRAEIHMLREFHRIILMAEIEEFRPLSFLRLQKTEELSSSLTSTIEKERKRLGLESLMIARDLMVTERVQGLSLLQIVMSTTISSQAKREIVERYNLAMLKIYNYIQKNYTYSAVWSVRSSNSRGLQHELGYPSAYLHLNMNPNGIPIELYFDLNDNIIVDSNGKFVLVDPN